MKDRFRPSVETLEDRTAPALVTWRGGYTDPITGFGYQLKWEENNNWIPAGVPGPDDDVQIPGLGGSTQHQPVLGEPATIRSLSSGPMGVGDAPPQVVLRNHLTLAGGISHWHGANIRNYSPIVGTYPDGRLTVRGGEFSWYSGEIALSFLVVVEGGVLNVRQSAGPLRGTLEVGGDGDGYANLSSLDSLHAMWGDLLCECDIDIRDQGLLTFHEQFDPLVAGGITFDDHAPYAGQDVWISPGGKLLRTGYPAGGYWPGVILELPVTNHGTVELEYNGRLWINLPAAPVQYQFMNQGFVILHDQSELMAASGMAVGLGGWVIVTGGEARVTGGIDFYGGELVIGFDEAAELQVWGGDVHVLGNGFHYNAVVETGILGTGLSSFLNVVQGSFIIEPGTDARLTATTVGPAPAPLDRWRLVQASVECLGVFATVLVVGHDLDIDYEDIYIDLYRL